MHSLNGTWFIKNESFGFWLEVIRTLEKEMPRSRYGAVLIEGAYLSALLR